MKISIILLLLLAISLFAGLFAYSDNQPAATLGDNSPAVIAQEQPVNCHDMAPPGEPAAAYADEQTYIDTLIADEFMIDIAYLPEPLVAAKAPN